MAAMNITTLRAFAVSARKAPDLDKFRIDTRFAQ
jgi:hypothetical protein